MHQQQSAESLITRSVSESAYSSQAVSAAAPRITCLHRCEAPVEGGTGTFLSRTSSLLRLALRVSGKSGNAEQLFRALDTLTVRWANGDVLASSRILVNAQLMSLKK